MIQRLKTTHFYTVLVGLMKEKSNVLKHKVAPMRIEKLNLFVELLVLKTHILLLK